MYNHAGIWGLRLYTSLSYPPPSPAHHRRLLASVVSKAVTTVALYPTFQSHQLPALPPLFSQRIVAFARSIHLTL